ncbi:MAG: NAD(P)/FAD-dependent oxidoreductase [Peptoniphilaceae bacterium]|nr:NAD(P)/FAD-dependent oxidoreductase [Peptoniphilaceae bacterium]MDY6018947.1 NAD(P)/FAD-dependent oxidoreductase [Anaerococcus sp.]
MEYTKLFEKAKIGNLTLKNRIVMPPMGTGLADISGQASENIIRYYEERAKGGCGLIITEICRVDEEHGWGAGTQLAATKTGHITGLQRLADRVHAYGSKIFLQLHHPGREGSSRINPNGNYIVAPSSFTTPVCQEEPHELTIEEAKTIQTYYIKAAVFAKLAGMDGVELHGAHGYFLNQWLSPFSNRRTDQYGGSFENRMRYVDEIIMGIKQYCGENFPLGIRLSVEEFIGDKGITLEEGVKIAKHMEEMGVSYIHVSCGIYESNNEIIPPYSYEQGSRSYLVKAVKDAVNIPVVGINVLKEPEYAEKVLEEGICDFVSVGRGQLADPHWGKKAQEGHSDLIRKCIGCNRCINALPQGRHVECSVNPRLGYEAYFDDKNLVKDGNGRKVVVIGAGPAGVETAIVLGKRGFDVSLYEEKDHIGGAIYLGGLGNHKEKLLWFVETQKKELENAGVQVKLNTKANYENVKAEKPEAIFICAGGIPIKPSNIEGIESDKVIMAEDFLEGKKEAGKKVAVIGSGATGLEVADTLKTKDPDRQVSVIEMTKTIGASEIERIRKLVVNKLKTNGVDLLPLHKLVGVTDSGIKVEVSEEGKDPVQKEMDFDTVILALGSRPQADLIDQFQGIAKDIRSYGDSVKVATLLEALRDAHFTAWAYE